MPPRALIIGIETYPQAVDLAPAITGAAEGAAQFYDWVTTAKGVLPPDTYVCASGGAYAGAHRFGTEREAIVDAIAALVGAGQDQTDQLFVYFSGHGYGFKESLERRAVDVLIGSDYRDADRFTHGYAQALLICAASLACAVVIALVAFRTRPAALER